MRKRITAGELVARQEADPEFVARRAAKDAEIAARVAGWRAAQAPLLEELREAGFPLESVWDLIPRAEPYPEALPILLKHLQLDYPAAVTEGIARAFATRESTFGWDVLRRLFESAVEKRAKDGIAVALSASATEAQVEALFELLGDPRHGTTRILLLGGVERSNALGLYERLELLASDPDLAYEIPRTLKRLAKRRR